MSNRYTKTAVILHWLIGFGMIGMLTFGWFMTDLPREAPKQMSYDLFNWGIYTWELVKEASPREFYYNLHKSFGITIMSLIVLRIFWRITHKPPTPLISYKAWERKLSTGAHHLLYALMVIIPISGLIQSVASKYGVKWFGIKLLGGLDSEPLKDAFHETHEIAATLLFFIVLIHVIAALKHKFINKDETMKRMMP